MERLLRDPRRLVYITAMDAAWNRKPTPAMIKTVWRRAVLLGMQFYNPPNIQHVAMFRGQRIILYTNKDYWVQVQNGVYATRLLLHWKPRGLSRLVVASLAQMALIPPAQSIFNTPYIPQAKDFAKLLAGVNPAAVEPYLLHEINRPMVQNFMFNANNKPGHFSNRTLPLHVLVQMAHLNPSLYHLYHTPMNGGVWATGTVAQENADIKKITAWYAKKGIKPITAAGVGGQTSRLQAQPAPATTATPTGDIAKVLEKFRQGLKELGSPKYATRRAGSAALREALASLMARMIKVIGPERQARVDHLLEYQGDLTRWARALMQLPPQRRLKMLQWGISPPRSPLVAGVFSPQQQRRADIAHPLAKIPGRNAAWLLDRLLRDPRRLVYITAMDAAWNRKPTPAMLKTVWWHAVLLGMQFYNPPNNQHVAVFRGKRIGIVTNNNNYWLQVQDGVYATRLLLHWKPRGLSRLVVASLAQMALIPPTQSIFNTPYTPQAKDFAKLLAGVKPATVEPYLLHEINRPMVNNVTFNFNNKPIHFSNRTLPLHVLVQMAHLNPIEYHLYHTSVYGGVWATGTVAQENADIKKITAWYAKKGIKPIMAALPNRF